MTGPLFAVLLVLCVAAIVGCIVVSPWFSLLLIPAAALLVLA